MHKIFTRCDITDNNVNKKCFFYETTVTVVHERKLTSFIGIGNTGFLFENTFRSYKICKFSLLLEYYIIEYKQM